MRDRTILRLIADALTATNAFDEVGTSGLPEDSGNAASDARFAALELAGWSEEADWCDTADVTIERTVMFHLWVLTRMDDPDTRDDECDRLVQVAANAIGGNSFGTTCVAPLSQLKSGKYLPATAPERRCQCQGQFVYFVNGFAQRDSS